MAQSGIFYKHHKWVELILAAITFYLSLALAILSIQQSNVPLEGYASLVIVPAALAFTVCIYCLVKNNQKTWILVIFFGMGLYLALLSSNYNVIDETAHHTFIRQIIANHSLPTVQQNYEAVHPPLYYLVMAGLTFFIKSDLVSLYLLRFFNLALLLCCYMVLSKIIGLLRVQKLIVNDHFVYDYLPIFWVFCTGLLYRGATVTNEIFTVLFATITIYLLCKLVAEDSTSKWLWLAISLSVTCGILSRITNVFLLVVLLCVFLYRRLFKEMLFSLLTTAALVAPWFVQNILRYGALTGNKQHLEQVLQLLWHQDTPLGAKTLFTGLFNILDRYFFPDDFWKIEHPIEIVNSIAKIVFWMLIISAVIRLFYLGIRFLVKKLQFDYSLAEKRQVLEMIGACSLLCVLAITFYMSFEANLDVFRGRYLYAASSASMLISVLYLDKIPKKTNFLRSIVCALLIFYSACVASYSLQRSFLYQILEQTSPLS